MDRSHQQRLLGEIDAFLDAGSTAQADEQLRIEVEGYRSEDVARTEVDALFRRTPLAVAHSSQLAQPGDFVAVDVAATPLLLVRQEDRTVRALVNVCQHRGARVCDEAAGSARTFTCPFHAWTYRIDGSLRSLPFADGFRPSVTSELRLPVVQATERHGLVWVRLEGSEPIDVRAHLGAALDDELAGFPWHDTVVERSTELREDVNWKVVVEAFLETYHISSLHSRTLGRFILPNVSAFEAFGPHHRLVGVRESYVAKREAPAATRDLLHDTAVQYCIVPNLLLVWQQDHCEVWTAHPGRTPGESVVRVSLVVPADQVGDRTRWDKNWRILTNAVVREDFVIGRTIQQSVDSGVLDAFSIGRNEPAIQHFHRAIDDVLAERG